MITKEQFISQARTWIGTPYEHQGRSKKSGVDCVGLILGTAFELQLPLEDKSEFLSISRNPPRGTKMIRWIEQQLGTEVGPPRPASLGVFWISRTSKRPQHLALFSEDNGRLTLIHCSSYSKKVCEILYDEEWQQRFIAAYSFPGVESWQQ